MRIELKLIEGIEEPYAVVYAGSMTEEVQNFIEAAGAPTGVITAMQEERIIVLKEQDVYMIRVEEEKTAIYCRDKKYYSKKRLYELERICSRKFMKISKTTLINLLMRFYDVDKGAIRIDGIDTKSMSRSDVRSLFGMVLQDAWLYQGTIADNIRFGKLDATDYEVVDAAKTANVDHFIRTMPDGYDMAINSEGDNVSLGQKQLLTIARAVVSDPKILILDEATSSVDTRLEALIQKAMDRVMEGRTSFVIAHRLSTIRDADLILVMDQGQIIEKGTHESLLAQGGFYEKLYNSQFAEEAE